MENIPPAFLLAQCGKNFITTVPGTCTGTPYWYCVGAGHRIMHDGCGAFLTKDHLALYVLLSQFGAFPRNDIFSNVVEHGRETVIISAQLSCHC